MKKFLYLFILLMVFSSGYRYKQDDISQRIYFVFFKKIHSVRMLKISPESLENTNDIDIKNPKELDVFKNEMKNITV